MSSEGWEVMCSRSYFGEFETLLSRVNRVFVKPLTLPILVLINCIEIEIFKSKV